MSYSDIEEDSDIEIEEDPREKAITDLVNACKYG